MDHRLEVSARITDPTKVGENKFQDGKLVVDRYGYCDISIVNSEKKVVGEARLSEFAVRAILGFLADMGRVPRKRVDSED